MTKKQLYIHSGMHKTGTTSIQHALGKNVQILRDADIISPEKGLYPGVRAHHHAVWSLAEEPPRYFDPQQGNFSELVSEIRRSPHQHFVISSEEFFTRSDTEIANTKTLLGGDIQPTWIMYIRNPADWIVASWSQRVRLGDSTISIQERIQSERINRIEDSVYRLVHFFGIENVNIRLYDEVKQNDGLIADFWQAIDVPPQTQQKLLMPDRHNVSPSYLITHIMYELHQYTDFESPIMKQKPLVPKYYEWLWEYDQVLQEKYGQVKLHLTPEQHAAIDRIYASGNRRIARDFFQRDKLFPDVDRHTPNETPAVPRFDRQDVFKLLAFLAEKAIAYEIENQQQIKQTDTKLNKKTILSYLKQIR